MRRNTRAVAGALGTSLVTASHRNKPGRKATVAAITSVLFSSEDGCRTSVTQPNGSKPHK